LPAEVVYDAIQQATASDTRIETLQGDIGKRAIAIAGAGTRNRRAGSAGYALTVFGRSTRDSNCDCDRSQEASLLQTVYLQNDRDVLQLVAARPGTWLQEVARQVQPQSAEPRTGTAAGQRQLANYRRQLAAAQRRLDGLRRSGDTEAARRLARRVAVLRRQIQELEPAPQTSTKSPSGAETDWEKLVRSAYLRTLSRHPNAEELSRALQYLTTSETPVDGLRDVLWALLNTKEFIVNH
jgi:hypothetical protein